MKRKKNWYIFSGHILWCCGAACFHHTVLIWFKSKLLWLNTLWPAQMQSVFSIIAFRLPSYQHTSARLIQAFCFQSSSRIFTKCLVYNFFIKFCNNCLFQKLMLRTKFVLLYNLSVMCRCLEVISVCKVFITVQTKRCLLPRSQKYAENCKLN